MKWTKEYPKTPGFYWLKRESESNRVVEVYSTEDNSLFVVLTPTAHIHIYDMRKKCEWSDESVSAPEGGT